MEILEYDDMTIGGFIRGRREQMKLSRNELSRRSYVSRTALENYESGVTTPSIQTLRKLLKTLGVDEVRIKT